MLHTELSSAHYFLGPGDIKRFLPGRRKREVLKDAQWRGHFLMAGRYEDDCICIISYQLFSAEPSGEGGEVLLAVFRDDKFDKWVNYPKPEILLVPYEGTTRTRPKPIKIGNTDWLIRAVKSEAVDISELEKEVKVRPSTPSQIDPGLTIAFLALKAIGHMPAPATEKDYIRNAQLRDQFNAARLDIGMSPDEVQAIFNAKSLESGKVAAGTFDVYGSDETFNIAPVLLYSNVLILYQDSKATAIYAIEGGDDWRQNAEERFSDFSVKER